MVKQISYVGPVRIDQTRSNGNITEYRVLYKQGEHRWYSLEDVQCRMLQRMILTFIRRSEEYRLPALGANMESTPASSPRHLEPTPTIDNKSDDNEDKISTSLNGTATTESGVSHLPSPVTPQSTEPQPPSRPNNGSGENSKNNAAKSTKNSSLGEIVGNATPLGKRKAASGRKTYVFDSDSEDDGHFEIVKRTPSTSTPRKRRKTMSYTPSTPSSRRSSTNSSFMEDEVEVDFDSMRDHRNMYSSAQPPMDYYVGTDNKNFMNRVVKDCAGYEFISKDTIVPKFFNMALVNHLDSVLGRSEKHVQVSIPYIHRYFQSIFDAMDIKTMPPRLVFDEIARILLETSSLPLSQDDEQLLNEMNRDYNPNLLPSIMNDRLSQSYNMKIQEIVKPWEQLMKSFYWDSSYFVPDAETWRPTAYNFLYSMVHFFEHASHAEYFRICVEHLYKDMKHKMQVYTVAKQQSSGVVSERTSVDYEYRWRAQQTLFWQMARTVKEQYNSGYSYYLDVIDIVLDLITYLYYNHGESLHVNSSGALFAKLLEMVLIISEAALKSHHNTLQERILKRTRDRFPESALLCLLGQSEQFRLLFLDNISNYTWNKMKHPTMKNAPREINVTSFVQYYTKLQVLNYDPFEEEERIEEKNPFTHRHRLLAIIIDLIIHELFVPPSFTEEDENYKTVAIAARDFASRIQAEVEKDSNTQAREDVTLIADTIKYLFYPDLGDEEVLSFPEAGCQTQKVRSRGKASH